MSYIAVLPGDGIGAEVINESLKVLNAVEQISGKKYEIRKGDVGGGAYDKYGDPLPSQTMELIENCNSVLFGLAVTPVPCIIVNGCLKILAIYIPTN